MEKSDFVRLAPDYYALAVALEMRSQGGHISDASLREAYTVYDTESDHSHEYLPYSNMLGIAIERLVAEGAIVETSDPFGPSLYERSDSFDEFFERKRADKSGPFYRAMLAPSPPEWIRRALNKVNESFRELGVTDEDLRRKDDSWAPIPIERGNPAVETAISTIEDTITRVEQSNGYSSEHGEERAYVLDNLKLLANRLKNAASISVGYVKAHGLSILKRVEERFAGTFIEESAKASARALWELIKGFF